MRQGNRGKAWDLATEAMYGKRDKGWDKTKGNRSKAWDVVIEERQ